MGSRGPQRTETRRFDSSHQWRYAGRDRLAGSKRHCPDQPGLDCRHCPAPRLACPDHTGWLNRAGAHIGHRRTVLLLPRWLLADWAIPTSVATLRASRRGRHRSPRIAPRLALVATSIPRPRIRFRMACCRARHPPVVLRIPGGQATRPPAVDAIRHLARRSGAWLLAQAPPCQPMLESYRSKPKLYKG